ncbi:anti-sigma factor family protein [Parasulfitobacter algicola]|uniref:Anti-sigma factor n=1 Tax=Parasulfitobacter algicola TaxID=2614809 RepID=A0ABX2IKN2_9RHOB|nr:anti-sigma factor [Sulfitobacter algicola]NSX53419.1 anti-sigma factor [Sulfitobacter algicola]
MTDFSIKLSAYLDGELNPVDTKEVEDRLSNDPEAQAEMDALMAADALALEQFDQQLAAPIPMALAKTIKSAPIDRPVRSIASVWGSIAAGLVLFVLGGTGGFMIKDQISPPTTIASAGWLQDISEYHAVYASQGRHLVEVGADEADHIQTWLGNTVGAEFTIPDLSQFGLTFEGGRLLVANAKPVAQLMYRDASGTVIALCLQSRTNQPTPNADFNQTTLNGFDLVSWAANGVNYVVVGPDGRSDLTDIANFAANEV